MAEHGLLGFLREDSEAATKLAMAAMTAGKKRAKAQGAVALPKKPTKVGKPSFELTDQETEQLRQRNMQRFRDHMQGGLHSADAQAPPARAALPAAGGVVVDRSGGNVGDAQQRVRGTSAALEKSYLRLTAAPDPRTVRPPQQLAKCLQAAGRIMRGPKPAPPEAVQREPALSAGDHTRHCSQHLYPFFLAVDSVKSLPAAPPRPAGAGARGAAVVHSSARHADRRGSRLRKHVKDEWIRAEDYAWCCDQLKAIRQDLMVQGVRSQLTADVYCHHMRMALEYGDMNEFNQCQSALQALRAEGMAMPPAMQDEFDGYLLLYLLHFQDPHKLAQTLRGLSPQQRAGPIVAFAIATWRAVTAGNYHAYFRLYADAPAMAPYLLDYRLNPMREAAYARIVAGYGGALPLAFVSGELAFASEAECRAFAQRHGAVFRDDGSIDVRATRAAARR
ncbi:SAC3/GANP/Nin1/mts3/eIF-3 p25 family-domain-containing protein [Tribonema minus]|uniref:SAC3/GANP/Nin1/mts3/eIF-3 p25 family-domain-containing protein n=1 Tax=Tribonema minus TaxID=303371 RepID=A0A835Z6Q7_9STRA|nr:SAC3/GANP/Nin1/mts3/eIF-3 p25 family-domain-containing protein [Tribonema minus]